MKKRVLVFPAGSEIALEINNALKYSTHFEVYGLSSVPCHAAYVYSNYIEGIPFYTESNFCEELNQIIDENQIDFIYPAYDDIQLYLTENKDRFHAQIVTSELDTVRICRSKETTYRYFNMLEFIPEFYSSIDGVTSFPVFVKPDVGQGSQGAMIVDTKEELELALKKNPDLIICEYLPGDEFTIDCLTDNKGELRVCRMRDRKRIRNGISVSSQRLAVPDDILHMAQEINRRLKFCGAWFFQIKKNDKGEYRLMEIAPRIAGTMGMSRNTGVNFPLLTLFCLMELPVDIIENEYHIEVDRALISRYHTDLDYDTIYVDLDDTLIVNGRINTVLIQYLYQTVNQGKRRILLTKHSREVSDTLLENRISESLFDEVIRIDRDKEKRDYIHYKKSIFIDDSFSERKKISQACNIPVFDCSEVEALLDWRV
jgi:Carbamoylphosphate synthase large subunit (split gene in MJ)